MTASTFVTKTHKVKLNEEYINTIQSLHKHREAQLLMFLSVFVDKENNIYMLRSQKNFICETLGIAPKTYDNIISKLIKQGSIKRLDSNVLHIEAPFYIIKEPRYLRKLQKSVYDL